MEAKNHKNGSTSVTLSKIEAEYLFNMVRNGRLQTLAYADMCSAVGTEVDKDAISELSVTIMTALQRRFGIRDAGQEVGKTGYFEFI